MPDALEPPLRHFHPDDADAVARLNDMASGGLLLAQWTDEAGSAGDPWELGRLQQIDQMKSGWVMIVLDQGQGVEAVLMGQAHSNEPVGTEGVDPVWVPLVELENLVPGSWCLNVIATFPESRGRGHGAILMGKAEALAREGGHRALSLVVADANIDAIRLYHRYGFSEHARRPMVKGDWDGPGQDWVLMVKPLEERCDGGQSPLIRTFRKATLRDLDQCFAIETSAYEGDEAATRAKIATRISTYPEGFLIAEVDGQIVGFINAGCSYEVEMSDEDFKELVGHDPKAPNVVIMSVVVDPSEQGKGHSRALVEEFHGRMRSLGKQSIHLICKEQHVPLYDVNRHAKLTHLGGL